ncbi:synaptonemal complex protein 3-like, partial [Crocuta crocuta]
MRAVSVVVAAAAAASPLARPPGGHSVQGACLSQGAAPSTCAWTTNQRRSCPGTAGWLFAMARPSEELRSGLGVEVTVGNDPIPDNPGASSPSEGTFEDDLRDEVQKMLEGLGAEIKQALLTKRKKFEMDTKASIKTTSETIEHIWKTQQEQRQNLHLKYSQQFLTLFREWNIDMRKAQEQEEKLASMFQEQRKVLHQARVVQKQRLQKIKNLHTQFLK